MKLVLGKECFTRMRHCAYEALESMVPYGITEEVKLCVGEVLANSNKHGLGESVELKAWHDLQLFALVVAIQSDSLMQNYDRLSKFLFECDTRCHCGLLKTHGRGLDMVCCFADKVTLSEEGDLRLYFAQIPPDFDLSRMFDNMRESLFWEINI